ncbi:TPA: hypothetical protein LP258_002535, partial [Enterococcus faecium]|nr:hypothetical protein [Enterococcus faecium]HBL1485724.1 hypothetical protein [Enterococcus faecium]HBL3254837.1 hypothetical protein [Enterococcus faecium]HBL3448809.1 hypothetical protein [Enterococcus faecium]
SIDFGDYDYSGNPNLMANINADSFSQGTGALSVIDDGDEVVVTLDPNHKLELYKVKSQPALVVGETYNMSVEIMLEDDFTGDPSKIALRYFKIPNWVPALTTPNALTTAKGVWQKLTVTAKMTTAIDNAESWYVTLYNQDANNSLSGRLRLRHAKLEEGSTATPYQPNLLDAPYYLSKVPLGKNIADPTVGFPHNTSEYMVYGGRNTENYIADQTYTLSMKATKLASQSFAVYIAGKVVDMKPTEGLTDAWELTFTVTKQHIDSGATNYLQIYQAPSATKGAVKIDWLKIEKSDTRTPNISQFKYFGEGLKDSNNPNDYSWDVTPEYTEKALTNTLNLTDPQTALGLKNFKDGAQIDGVDVATVKNLGSVLQSGSGLTTIQSDKQSAFDEFSYEFERIGDRVFFHARVKTNSKTAVASHVNLLEIPLGFQSPIGWTIIGIPLSVVQWTTPQGEISALVITDLTGKQVVKFATNRVGNHYISGEWRTADSYPETK